MDMRGDAFAGALPSVARSSKCEGRRPFKGCNGAVKGAYSAFFDENSGK